ncbi:MAG: preprotein translocase subunit YajC [Rhodospirillales bacterium]|nr:MAG: preprotein translocase subunit YajC [Rhodospirillales bacterium]
MPWLAAQALLIAIVFVIFFLVLVRPQLVRLKRHREMLAGLRPGLRVATVGGLVGTIVSVDGSDLLTLEVGHGMTVTVLRKAVDSLIEPASTFSTQPSLAERSALRRKVTRLQPVSTKELEPWS